MPHSRQCTQGGLQFKIMAYNLIDMKQREKRMRMKEENKKIQVPARVVSHIVPIYSQINIYL